MDRWHFLRVSGTVKDLCERFSCVVECEGNERVYLESRDESDEVFQEQSI